MSKPAAILPASIDRSDTFVKVFSYDQPQTPYVVPMEGSVADGVGINGILTGEVTLVAGVATISVPQIKTTSRVFLQRRTVGGTAGNMGFTRTAGTGFSITNSSNSDTSVVNWMVVV